MLPPRRPPTNLSSNKMPRNRLCNCRIKQHPRRAKWTACPSLRPCELETELYSHPSSRGNGVGRHLLLPQEATASSSATGLGEPVRGRNSSPAFTHPITNLLVRIHILCIICRANVEYSDYPYARFDVNLNPLSYTDDGEDTCKKEDVQGGHTRNESLNARPLFQNTANIFQ